MEAQPKSWVWCPTCLSWKDSASETTFLNIEEDWRGDRMTFKCDECDGESKSFIVTKHARPRGGCND